MFGLVAAMGLMTVVSCSNSEEKADPVVIEQEAPDPAPVETADESNNMKIDANVDKDGKVSGGISTDIDLDDDK